MKIQNHVLKGNGTKFQESPNHGGKFSADLPDTIIIHYTAGSSANSAVKHLCDPRSKASAHLVVGRDGSVAQLVPFDTIAWHAGRSTYGGRVGFNKYAIGIEIDNAGTFKKSGAGFVAWFGTAYPEEEVIEAVHRNESSPAYWHKYTEKQINLVYDICSELIETYPISLILGHEEIAPGRKRDPGPAFPLDSLRDRLLHRDRSDEGALESPDIKKAGLVTASKLNIRSSPAFDAITVAPPLPKGALVNIIQERGGWYEVDVTTQGWVKKEYIRT